jgi:toxin-antitoxin system PIN domain toxin
VTDLLDVNLLVSLAWPNHIHHGSAQRWFHHGPPRAWATTPITESGFVRVSSNRSAIPTAVAPAQAISLLARMREVTGHTFLPDDIELVTGDDQVDVTRVVTYRSVTDAHLLALARRHGARLATFDRGVRALAGRDAEDVVLVPMT